MPIRLSTAVEVAGPGFINLTLAPAFWHASVSRMCWTRARTTAVERIGAARGQRRICLGQPDRADACRPLPRRGVRRCARQPARLRRLRGHARILRQRRRRAGRYAGALGLSALPRGAGRGHRRDSRRALSRRLPEAGRPGAGRASMAARLRHCPRANGCRIVRDARHRSHDGDDRGGSGALNIRHDVFFSERSLQSRPATRSPRRIAELQRQGPHLQGRLPPPKGKTTRTGRTASRRCSARPSSATTSTGR